MESSTAQSAGDLKLQAQIRLLASECKYALAVHWSTTGLTEDDTKKNVEVGHALARMQEMLVSMALERDETK